MKAICDLFDTLSAAPVAAGNRHSIEVATASMLVEIVRTAAC